jgi:outer membrane protein assembly factor BamB
MLPALLALVVWSSAALADEWPNWRGPSQNGVASHQSFPLRWSKTENVAWVVDLPGKGASTPIVSQGHLILTSGDQGRNLALCYTTGGELKWSREIGQEREGKHAKATGCNSSPITDGKTIFVYFKSGDLAALDFDGKILWQLNLQKEFGADTLWWDLGTSPVLTRKHVVVAVMQTGPSYLVAIDKQTGKPAWKHDRDLNAPSEAAQSYSTPLVLEEKDRETLVVLGADHVTAHNAATGAEIWRVGGLNPTEQKFFRSIASPVVCGDVVVSPYARGSTLTGIKLGGQGDVTKQQVVWFREKLGADVPTPAAQEGKVYLCTDRGEVHCLDGKTGQTLWSGAVEKNRNAFSASPVLAGGRIYITREDGTTFVLGAGDKFEQLGVNTLDDEFVVATPVFVDGRIYIRTRERLYAIGG